MKRIGAKDRIGQRIDEPGAPSTPTPWKVQHYSILQTHSEAIGIIATVHPAEDGDLDCSEAAANAALIVRAVNSHEGLLEVCQALDRFAKPFPRGRDWENAACTDELAATISLARAAIAAADPDQPAGTG